jgi:hypothetical protein
VLALKNANPFYLGISLFPLGLSLYFITRRWQTLLSSMGFEVPPWKCFSVLMAAYPLTAVTPSKAGDFVRAYYLKDEIPMTRTIGSVLTEKIFDVVVLIAFSLLGMIYCQCYEFIWLFVISLALISLFVLVLRRGLSLPISSSWNDRIDNIALSMRSLLDNRALFVKITLYSILIWILAMLQILMFFFALDIDVDLLYLFANMPIAIFIGMLPISIGGMGTRDAAIIFLFSDYGTISELLAVGILFSLFRYWLLSVIGLLFMNRLTKN